jgi:hypothetical protein
MSSNAFNIPISIILNEARQPNGKYGIEGVAIHAGHTYHPNESVEVREWGDQELNTQAHTMEGKPLIFDHKTILNGCKVTSCWYDPIKRALNYKGEVTPEVAQWIRNGYVKGVSVEVNWQVPGGSVHYVDGFAAKGFVFEGLSLLHELQPGDPKAFVKLMEAVFIPHPHEPTEPTETQEMPEPLTKRVPTLRERIKRKAGI